MKEFRIDLQFMRAASRLWRELHAPVYMIFLDMYESLVLLLHALVERDLCAVDADGQAPDGR